MLRVWKHVLNVPYSHTISTDARFFEVGGDSVKLVELSYALRSEYGLSDTTELRVSEIHANDTIRGLTMLIKRKKEVQRLLCNEGSTQRGLSPIM